MAAAVLVDTDVEMGGELLRILDEIKFPVTAAAWIFFPDIEEWRLAAMGRFIRADGISNIRFSRNVIDGVLIDDALIYRLAA